MRSFSQVRTSSAIFALAAVAAVIAGYSTAPAAAPATHATVSHRGRSGWLSSQARTAQILYVANSTSQTITMYDAAAKQADPRVIGVIIDGVVNPTAMAVDGAGDLFVANASAGSQPA